MEARNNSGLLHSCGIICTTEPQTIFTTLGQLKSNNSMSLHPSGLIKCNISTYKCCCATINTHLSSASYAHDHWPSRTNSRAISILSLLCQGNNKRTMFKAITNFTLKLRGIFNKYLQRVGMIAMFCSENIVKVFSVQYTYYTLNSMLIHIFVYLHSNLAYQMGNKSNLQL